MKSLSLPLGTVLKSRNNIYTIEKVLGQGSFGITYLGSTRMKLSGPLGTIETDVNVAIKEFFMRNVSSRSGTYVLNSGNTELYNKYKRGFIEEAYKISRLKHPNIINVLETFEENSTCYISMEYIDGGSWDEYIRKQGHLSEYEALEGVLEIGEALAYMHKDRLLHLDVKPMNVMHRKDGRLVLIDFGLSKQFDSKGNPETSTSIGGGSMGYAPLEQFCYKKGDGFVPTLDIYALGATLFKALTGTTPPEASVVFNEGFPEEIMRNMGVSDESILLTSWAMEPMKRKRPQEMDVFLDEIRRILFGASKQKRTTIKEENKHCDDTLPTVNVFSHEDFEEINGFHVRWEKDLSDNRKNIIRKLLKSMYQIGVKEECSYSEYGNEVVDYKPIMLSSYKSFLFDLANKCAFWSLFNIIKLFSDLEKVTGLPFRLPKPSEYNYSYECSGPVEYWNGLKSLYFSEQEGLEYIGYLDNKGMHKLDFLTPNEYLEDYDFQIVCDRMKPFYVNNIFDTPNTQINCDEIVPMGLGFYKIRRTGKWNLVSRANPSKVLLNEDYESINGLELTSIPGPGLPIPFIGLKIKDSKFITFFQLKKNEFIFRGKFTENELEKMALFS